MARTVADIEADITKARAAIDSCLEAASYSISGRSKSMALLPHLKSHLNDLLAELSAASGKSQVTYPSFRPKT